MHSPEPQPRLNVSEDHQIELAKERNRIAADRTLLTWIRTSITLIAFGFGLEQVIHLIDTGPNLVDPLLISQVLGLVFVGTGVLVAIAGAVDYHREIQRLRNTVYFYTPRFSLGRLVARIIFAISVVTLVSIWL